MPSIFVDLERLKNPYCGLGQFSKSLGQSLINNNSGNIDFTFFIPKKSTGLFNNSVKFNYVSAYKKSIFHLSKLFFSQNIDLWHTTHQDSEYFPFHFNGKIILTIHDLNFLQSKKSWKVKKRLNSLQNKINKSDHVTTISNFVKKEIINNFDIDEEKITPIYIGVDLDDEKSPIKPDIPNGEFLFTIGQVVEKKNFLTLVSMMTHLPNFKLVIAGNNNSNYAAHIKNKINELKLNHRVFLIGPVSDQQRLWLFKQCRAFVFPSLAEGFGIPPIEAMSVGKPVFISRLTSLPEIAGDHAYYWDRFEPEYMANEVISGLHDFNSNPDKKAMQIAHADNYNWDTTSKRYLELYNILLNER